MKNQIQEQKGGVPRKITMIIFRNGKKVRRYHQTKQRDFIWFLNRVKRQNFDYIYFCVDYAKELDVNNKLRSMKNEFCCHSIADLQWAYKSFYKEYV
jgi:hypothetical protein